MEYLQLNDINYIHRLTYQDVHMATAKKIPTVTLTALVIDGTTPTATTAAVKSAAKPVVKVAAKTAGTPAKKSASPRTAAKPAATKAKTPAATPDSAASKAEKAAKKPKLVRDSFTIPKLEYLVLDELKARAAKLASPAKKSEVLRAGVKALAAMSDAGFLSALKAVPAVKTGRPNKLAAD